MITACVGSGRFTGVGVAWLSDLVEFDDGGKGVLGGSRSDSAIGRWNRETRAMSRVSREKRWTITRDTTRQHRRSITWQVREWTYGQIASRRNVPRTKIVHLRTCAGQYPVLTQSLVEVRRADSPPTLPFVTYQTRFLTSSQTS